MQMLSLLEDKIVSLVELVLALRKENSALAEKTIQLQIGHGSAENYQDHLEHGCW